MGGKSVIVVGNAPITNRGKFIDSFDIVIRMNTLKFRQNPKHYGKRIDIWAFRHHRRYQVIETLACFQIDRLWCFEQNRHNIKFQERVSNTGAPATTGFLTIMQALKQFGKCDIVGFNFFTTPHQNHYYDRKLQQKSNVVGCHRPDVEKKLLEENPNVTIHYEETDVGKLTKPIKRPKKIVMVGNAPQNNMGKKIDACDTVCRIKGYAVLALKKHHEDVGKKTDILYDFNNELKKHRQNENFKGIELVKFDLNLKRKKSIESNNKLTTGVASIFQTLERFGPPIYICGFEFSNSAEKGHFCKSPFDHLPSYDERQKPGFKSPFGEKDLKKLWKIDHFENFELEGKLVEKHVKKGDIIWLT